MKKILKKIVNGKSLIIVIVALAAIIIACIQPWNNHSSAGNGSNNVPVLKTEIDKQEQLTADIDKEKPIDTDIDWQALAKSYNPPKINALLREIGNSDTAADGSIVITAGIKREFNQMGEDYRFFFMPDTVWYDFESTGAALSYILYTWTGKFGTFPEKAPKYEAEARVRKIFAAPDNKYPLLEHQTYTKYVKFDGQSYTPWPESFNANTMIYDLTDLRVRQDGDFSYYTASANEYQFDLNGYYEPGENEKFFTARSDALGLDNAAALIRLLETGEISAAVKSSTYTIEFRTEGHNTTPMIISVEKWRT